MTLIRLFTAAALVATGGVCAAQVASAPAKKELVQKIVQLQQSGVDNVARGLAEQSVAPLAQQAGAVLQARIAPGEREAVARDIQAEFKKYGDDVVPTLQQHAQRLAPATLGPMLEERLSEDELKQVLALLESPAYRRYQQLAPEMQKALTEKLVAETRAQVEPKLKALQDTIARRLGLPAPSAAAAARKASGAAPKLGAPTPKK